MGKSGKQNSSVSVDGKWAVQPTGGFPLVSSQKSREYPFSQHDNKHSLKDNISVFEHGVGRRKCLGDRSQHNSHFCLGHNEAIGGGKEAGVGLTAYQADFVARGTVDVSTGNRRFSHNHRLKSEEAALARAGERFMWFGRHDSDQPETLEVLAATNVSALSKS